MIVRLTFAISYVLYRSFIMHWSEIALAFPYTQWSQRLYRTRYFLFSSKCVMLAKSARLYRERDIATVTHDRKCVLFIWHTKWNSVENETLALFLSHWQFDLTHSSEPNQIITHLNCCKITINKRRNTQNTTKKPSSIRYFFSLQIRHFFERLLQFVTTKQTNREFFA